MAKPEGITTGDGTQAHPYEVHSYEEIKWCCEDSEAIPEGQAATAYVYLKLVNDIDCQEYDVDFLWNISLTHWVNFDLNNKTIKTFYIAASAAMFAVAQWCFQLHDGKILNVYGHWETSSAGIITATTTTVKQVWNVSFSIDASKLPYIFSYSAGSTTNQTFKNCSFWIQGFHRCTSSGRCVLSNAQIAFTCCDFYFSMVDQGSTNFILAQSTSYALDNAQCMWSNCRFQGDIYINTPTAFQANTGLFNGVVRNCVWACNTHVHINSTSTTGYRVYIVLNSSTSTYGIYNTDLIDVTSESPLFIFASRANSYIECHNEDMDMRYNPNADQRLVELGFDVIKG